MHQKLEINEQRMSLEALKRVIDKGFNGSVIPFKGTGSFFYAEPPWQCH
jgi:hypothetical protein